MRPLACSELNDIHDFDTAQQLQKMLQQQLDYTLLQPFANVLLMVNI